MRKVQEIFTTEGTEGTEGRESENKTKKGPGRTPVKY